MCAFHTHHLVDDGVVHGWGLGEQRRNNRCGDGDRVWLSKRWHHWNHCIRDPSYQEACTDEHGYLGDNRKQPDQRSPSFLWAALIHFNFPMFTTSLQCLTYFCQFDLKVVVVFDAGIVVWNFLRRRLDLVYDHDIGENNDSSRENKTEEKHGHDEALTRNRGLCKPPVQRAGGSERFRGIIPPANQGHSGPEGCIQPNKGQAYEGVMAF